MTTTRIECTKDEFKATLIAEFGPLWENLPQRDNAEFLEVIDGLVEQANNTRGTFRGYNAYLDLDFEVGGVRQTGGPMITRGGVIRIVGTCGCLLAGQSVEEALTDNHQKTCTLNLHLLNTIEDEITIPAVTKAQADQSERAAYATVDLATGNLIALARDGRLTERNIQEAVHQLLAAAGHLALAESMKP